MVPVRHRFSVTAPSPPICLVESTEDRMAFFVTAADQSGRRSTLGFYDTPEEAIERAVQLMGQGLVDVLIADREGKYHTPAHFGRLFMINREPNA
jgi:hypothetical protein